MGEHESRQPSALDPRCRRGRDAESVQDPRGEQEGGVASSDGGQGCEGEESGRREVGEGDGDGKGEGEGEWNDAGAEVRE